MGAREWKAVTSVASSRLCKETQWRVLRVTTLTFLAISLPVQIAQTFREIQDPFRGIGSVPLS